ncbi:MAG: hypothetical protein IJK46_03825 [Prevotella sp.]|nr:hypothetical protein [Prevotella sp.]
MTYTIDYSKEADRTLRKWFKPRNTIPTNSISPMPPFTLTYRHEATGIITTNSTNLTNSDGAWYNGTKS